MSRLERVRLPDTHPETPNNGGALAEALTNMTKAVESFSVQAATSMGELIRLAEEFGRDVVSGVAA